MDKDDHFASGIFQVLEFYLLQGKWEMWVCYKKAIFQGSIVLGHVDSCRGSGWLTEYSWCLTRSFRGKVRPTEHLEAECHLSPNPDGPCQSHGCVSHVRGHSIDHQMWRSLGLEPRLHPLKTPLPLLILPLHSIFLLITYCLIHFISYLP